VNEGRRIEGNKERGRSRQVEKTGGREEGKKIEEAAEERGREKEGGREGEGERESPGLQGQCIK